MADSYRILYEGGSGSITVKKSRFIATLSPARSEHEAQEFIAGLRKKYWDASHNCPAFAIGGNNELTRCSDDGEPSQTAGRPMLNVLLTEGVHDACVVVTRYFGGTLLGTGGLSRAYADAVREGLKNCAVMEKRRGFYMDITADYAAIGKIRRAAENAGIMDAGSVYADVAAFRFLVPAGEYGAVEKRIMEVTDGRARISRGGEAWFGSAAGKAVIL